MNNIALVEIDRIASEVQTDSTDIYRFLSCFTIYLCISPDFNRDLDGCRAPKIQIRSHRPALRPCVNARGKNRRFASLVFDPVMACQRSTGSEVVMPDD